MDALKSIITDQINMFDNLIQIVPKLLNDKDAINREREQFIADITVKETKKDNLKKMKETLSNISEGEFFTVENEAEVITSGEKTQASPQELPKIQKKTWSFGEVHTNDDTETAKTIKNAFFANSIIKDIKAKKNLASVAILKEKETNLDVVALQKQIKCIECSIKKLELNLKLTNEDGIKDEEFLRLLTEISGLCGTETGEDDCKTNLQEFVDEVILKRDMNSIAGLIKMASFMCPILAFANKSLFSDLTAEAATETSGAAEKTVGICSKIIGYITRSGNEGILTLDDTATELDFIDKTHGIGVSEAIISFVGIGGADKSIEKKITGSIRSVVSRTVKNTIDTVLKTATLYQKIICMVFITLLSTHIYLTLIKKNGNVDDTEKYYKSSIEFLYDNMTNETMKIGFGNMEMITSTSTGGKRASKSRRAANAAKPRATRAAKAVSKAIAKAVAKPKPLPKTPTAKPTKPTKQPIKPTAKPTAKAVAKAVPKKKKN